MFEPGAFTLIDLECGCRLIVIRRNLVHQAKAAIWQGFTWVNCWHRIIE